MELQRYELSYRKRHDGDVEMAITKTASFLRRRDDLPEQDFEGSVHLRERRRVEPINSEPP